MDERDIEKVAEAFDRLLAHAARTCDQTVTWPIAAAKGDILEILAGEWHSDETPASGDDDMTQEEYDRLADLGFADAAERFAGERVEPLIVSLEPQ